MVSCVLIRLNVLRTLVAELPDTDKRKKLYRSFKCLVWCFPNPGEPQQADMIRRIVYMDNVTRDVTVPTTPLDRLKDLRYTYISRSNNIVL